MSSFLGRCGAMSLWLLPLAAVPARAQQFNSDNYLSKPAGMATVILPTGQQTTMWMTTFSLFPRWEFTAAAYLYNKDADRKTGDGYGTSVYAKWMLYENEAKTGGVAVKAGFGMKPSYVLDGAGYQDASQTYWVNAPFTIPLFDNRLSWDLMPGASLTANSGAGNDEKSAFTYSTRLAWYPTSPTWALVGEVFGAEGQAKLDPEYRVGFRWEPSQYANIAVSYGQKFNGSAGSGLEVGVMLFTPPFCCLAGCDKGAKP